MTHTAKHTPLHLNGEYLPDGSGVGDGVPCYICTEDGREIAQIYRKHPQAKVLAPKLAAAPAMYEALQRLFNGNVDCGSYWKVDVSDIQAAKNALAQAEGKRD